MEHRITLKESGVISVYADTVALKQYINDLIHDGVAFSYEFA